MTDNSDLVFHNANEQIVPYHGEAISWRVSVYAIVLQDDQLLIIKNSDEDFFDIPGGGVELGEDLSQALHRECMEEAGLTVNIGQLVHHCSGFFYHSELKKFYQTLQLFYLAQPVGELQTPTDPRTVSVQYVPLSELAKYPLPAGTLDAIKLV